MKKFKVELIFESSGDKNSDPSLTTEVTAKDEIEALDLAKVNLKKEKPDMNFMKVWCWHIETLRG
ncbi:MAG TPA: hypothetical protein PL133_08680 [Methylophilaceae bacterium]|nr:hypothetical protein [Methylophilaceae bacterium]HQC29464.1 hypothetical protein [Methylotenera sp.]